MWYIAWSHMKLVLYTVGGRLGRSGQALMGGKDWSRADLSIMIDRYQESTIEDLAKILHRSEKAIRSQALLMGMHRQTQKQLSIDYWTQEKIQILKEKYGLTPMKELVKILGRSNVSITK